jgi:hypothetical protein
LILIDWKAAESGQIEVVRTVEAVCDVSARELIEPLAQLRPVRGSWQQFGGVRGVSEQVGPVVLVGVVAAGGVD